jgi:hypothetical protein
MLSSNSDARLGLMKNGEKRSKNLFLGFFSLLLASKTLFFGMF